MSDQQQELRRQLNAKTREIEAYVAKALGLGDITALNPQTMRRLEEEVEQMIEQHDEAFNQDKTFEQWQILDRRLNKTEVGRLLQERHEIAEQILDIQDERISRT